MATGHRLTLILLPGLDGTGRLFSRLAEQLPGELEPRVVALPTDRELGYAELVRHARDQLPQDRLFALLGESFSGPVALRLAAERPPGLVALVLVASFHRRPVAWWGRAVKPFANVLRLGFGGPDLCTVRKLSLGQVHVHDALEPSRIEVRHHQAGPRSDDLTVRPPKLHVQDSMRRVAVPLQRRRQHRSTLLDLEGVRNHKDALAHAAIMSENSLLIAEKMRMMMKKK